MLAEIEKAAVDGVTLVSLCEKGDKLLEEETAKVYNNKKPKVTKGALLLLLISLPSYSST